MVKVVIVIIIIIIANCFIVVVVVVVVVFVVNQVAILAEKFCGDDKDGLQWYTDTMIQVVVFVVLSY